MHAVTRLPAARILTDRIVDDAGLFPPEALDMASALARHRSDQAISNPVPSQRFVCPAGRFVELHQQLDDSDRIQVIALGPAVPQTEAEVGSLEADDRTPVVALETSLPVDNQHKDHGFDHFGFLNLLLAVAAAQKDAGTNEVEHILAERNPNVVLQHITGLTTHDAFEIRAAFHSVGSCSTSEPIDDLRRLGLIADPT